jgi:hypothetical protein
MSSISRAQSVLSCLDHQILITNMVKKSVSLAGKYQPDPSLHVLTVLVMEDCHFHYSTRFAVKCVGCANAILKQFVEINRNQKDECWHPECYMIHKVSLELYAFEKPCVN